MTTFLYKSFTVFLIAAFMFCELPLNFALAQSETETPTEEDAANKSQEIINLVTGEVHSINANRLNRVAVANPDIIDISDAKPEQVFIAAKKPGQTELFIWDDSGKHSMIIRVASENLSTVKLRVQEILDRAQLKGISLEENPYEGKIVLYGTVSKLDKESLDKVMEPFSDNIINLVKIELNEDSVQIDAVIIELSTSLEKTLGIDWSDSTSGGSGGEGVAPLQPTVVETLPSTDGSVGDFFKIGNFNRLTPYQAALNVLINEGKGRVLSKPRLVVKSGKEASFLVGGEIPITSVSTTGGGSGTVTQSVEFKQYGVNMMVTPTIRDQKIDVTLNVKITDIDLANRVGSNVAYTSREAQTQLLLENNQTIVLAGLVKHNDSNNVRKVAFLGDIPVLGALFRSRSTPVTDTELVIVLTPTILRKAKIATEEVVMPSKRLKEINKEVEGNYEKESLKEPAKPKPAAPVSKESSKKVVKTVVSTSQVPDRAVLGYMRDVQLRISQAITYPYEALQKQWEGTVKLRLRILRDGTLADCDLLESSGHDIFDRDALTTAKTLSPFLSFPAEISQEDLVVTVPIVYHQGKAQKGSQTVMASY
jgi:pilus assembly protein CpaC